MAYKEPYIDYAGLHIPSYRDILEDLCDKFRLIYGEDIYLEPDSQDYQMISIFALKIYDTMQMLELVYNNRSPKHAVGTGLDSLVKINGIRRKRASHSTCEVEITGDVGAEIINGEVVDDDNNVWLLPSRVLIDESPKTVTVQAKELGDIRALKGSIQKIKTPTKGWVSVVNKKSALAGLPVETDEELRKRQSISSAGPSLGMCSSLVAGIAAIPSVRRYVVYENDTNLTDERGIAPHSVCCVVEGGRTEDIAREIYLRKGIGCGTYGDDRAVYMTREGLPVAVNFFRPKYKSVSIKVKYKKLDGFTLSTEDAIRERVRMYFDGLDIGQDIYVSAIWGAALSAIGDIKHPSFSVTEVLLGEGAPSLARDVVIKYNEIAQCGDVVLEEVR